jgi:uncharacterized protein with GYD domain
MVPALDELADISPIKGYGIKDSHKREEAFRKLCEKVGAKVKEAYRTMGRYDVAAIVDAPDDVTMNAVAYSLAATFVPRRCGVHLLDHLIRP